MGISAFDDPGFTNSHIDSTFLSKAITTLFLKFWAHPSTRIGEPTRNAARMEFDTGARI